jgi:hypothetical protein
MFHLSVQRIQAVTFNGVLPVGEWFGQREVALTRSLFLNIFQVPTSRMIINRLIMEGEKASDWPELNLPSSETSIGGLSDRIENLSISIARMRNTSLPRCAST